MPSIWSLGHVINYVRFHLRPYIICVMFKFSHCISLVPIVAPTIVVYQSCKYDITNGRFIRFISTMVHRWHKNTKRARSCLCRFNITHIQTHRVHSQASCSECVCWILNMRGVNTHHTHSICECVWVVACAPSYVWALNLLWMVHRKISLMDSEHSKHKQIRGASYKALKYDHSTR